MRVNTPVLVLLILLAVSIHAKNVGNDLLHHIYLLHQIMAQNMPGPNHLAQVLCDTADASSRVIAEVQYSEKTREAVSDHVRRNEVTSQEPRPSQKHKIFVDSQRVPLSGIAHILFELLKGLNKLGDLDGAAINRIRVIHSYIQVFQSLLGRICQLSITYAETLAHQAQDRRPIGQGRKKFPPCSSCKERHRKCDQTTPKCHNCKRKDLNCERGFISSSAVPELPTPPLQPLDSNIFNLCKLTISMMRNLDTRKATHMKIMEGFIFLLFERIGKGLKRFVFESNEETTSQDTTCSSDADNPLFPAYDHSGAEEAATKAQAPYLIWILDRVQSFVSQPNSQTVSEAAEPNPSSNNLAAIARNKLQYTLLKSVFGDQAPEGYEGAIESPHAPVDAELQKLGNVKIEVEDWYKHEVWRLLGWDVLKNHRWID